MKYKGSVIYCVHILRPNNDCVQGQYTLICVLILVHGLNLNHKVEIRHLCEFGPEGSIYSNDTILQRISRGLRLAREKGEGNIMDVVLLHLSPPTPF